MRIPDEIIRQLHEINCEDAAKRFGLDVKNHMAHCFNSHTILLHFSYSIFSNG